MEDLRLLTVRDDATIRDAMACIDRNGQGIALVVDERGLLSGTVTDGDVRRAVLRGLDLSSRVSDIMATKPVTALHGAELPALVALLERHRVRQLPIVDEDGRPVRLFTLADAARQPKSFDFAVIMAGGQGRRLRPLTDHVPKPMIRVQDMPIVERIVRAMATAGVRRIYMSVNYKAEVLKEHFGDGSRFGVDLRYLHEDEPLGTAGALSLLPEEPRGPILVVNGDVLTTTDFSLLFDFHRHHSAVATVAALTHEVQVPYGVLRTAHHYVVGLDEKPVVKLLCSAGIYALDPKALRHVPHGARLDMTQLLETLIHDGLPVIAWPIREYWADIGQPQDLERAEREFGAIVQQERPTP